MFKTLSMASVLFVMVSVVGCGAEEEKSSQSDADFQVKVEAYERAMASDF
ncbi:secreted protein [Rhodopirellula maiorica SM1]|uniref:Secreted protein n=1 Tax=Rhodopirellula maiorica SM1 TaxID=1265738 RepID=M5RVG3_9BACT|nr:hypothetical protein [Rhodopirellula maiorica]EMI17949.1 secreted protein [Rhodopirellula maiorica SM1]